MVQFKLSTEQAQALHDLLTSLNIEPPLTDCALLNGGAHVSDHGLWPLLDHLRQQLQIEYWDREVKCRITLATGPQN